MSSPEEKSRAAERLATIEALRAFEPFEYFTRRIGEKIAERERRILSPETGPDDTTTEKKIVEAIRADVLGLLDMDERGCRSILGQ